MKALVYKGAGTIELDDIEQQAPVGDESLIKVRAAGICGSDLEGFLGKTGRRIHYQQAGLEDRDPVA